MFLLEETELFTQLSIHNFEVLAMDTECSREAEPDTAVMSSQSSPICFFEQVIWLLSTYSTQVDQPTWEGEGVSFYSLRASAMSSAMVKQEEIQFPKANTTILANQRITVHASAMVILHPLPMILPNSYQPTSIPI
ncbi:hypothetical protein NE237_004186 [Protea cynaroides]|uniref:Uncharacterized protein n=1 Tax=Protea cynaroides TaxID=273540 RepID=A0A9Q0KIE1_9MAGN|nr:hypothetical protein NE237_004186 [Protea cynaroides]